MNAPVIEIPAVAATAKAESELPEPREHSPAVDADASPEPPPPPGTPSPRDQAKVRFVAGTQAYVLGDYATARRHWEEALQLDPSATLLLINIANAAIHEPDLRAACNAIARARAAGLPTGELSQLEARLPGTCP